VGGVSAWIRNPDLHNKKKSLTFTIYAWVFRREIKLFLNYVILKM